MENVVMLEEGMSRLSRVKSVEDQTDNLAEEGNHCFLLCRKVSPNIFFIKGGLAIIDEKKNLSQTEGLSVTCPTKIIFVSA